MDRDSVFLVVYPTNLNAVGVMDWIDSRVVAEPIESTIAKFGDNIGTNLKQFRRETKYIFFAFILVFVGVEIVGVEVV